jgi:hypothetical protein
MTSGRSAGAGARNASSAPSGIACMRCGRRHLPVVHLASDDVVGHVETGRAGTAVDRLPDCHLDVERDAVGFVNLHNLTASLLFVLPDGERGNVLIP